MSYPNQNQTTANDHQMGHGYDIDGIPLPESMPQDPKTSAEPNREDTDFNVKGDPESDYAVDYFDAEERRLGDMQDKRDVPNSDPDSWSDGIEDEANAGMGALDADFPDDNALPEMGKIELIEEPTPEQLDPNSSNRYITEP